MKTMLVCFLLIIGTVLAYPKETTFTLDGAINDSIAYLTDRLSQNAKVAVVNFSAPTTALSNHIMDELTAAIVNKPDGNLTAVDRQNLELVRQEMNYQLSGEVDDATALAIGKQLGVEAIIFGSIASVGRGYRMKVQATAVETALVQGIWTGDIKIDGVLRGLLQNSDEGSSVVEPVFRSGDEWKNKWLYLGVHAGLSQGFYKNGGGLMDSAIYHSQELTGLLAFDAALSASVSILNFLAIQVEAMFTADSFELYSGNKWLMSVSYTSLMIPLFAKVVWRPSRFMVQGYAGAYLSLPLGQLNVEHGNGSYTADYGVTPGFIGGGGGGIKLGPGVVFVDVRYLTDFGNLVANHNGNREISHRSKVAFSLGYEIGLIQK
ncbi:MAG: hypothetical protein LBU17_07375 [Treponema sp.]|jgi:hypothetical protein|nr:hypothetical protein [Treponema sp.]